MPVIAEQVSITVDNILVATDFSMVSHKALAYAKALTRRFGSTLEVVNVFDPANVITYEEAIMGFPADYRQRAAAENLEALEYELSADGIKAEAVTATGHQPTKEILALAKTHAAGLIVAGAHAKSGLEKMILGSTSEELIRSAECPVLTVGPLARDPNEDPLVFRSILYATDLSPQAARAAVYAFSFAEDSNAKLHCCFVAKNQPEDPAQREAGCEIAMKALQSMIPEDVYDWCDPKCVVASGDPAEAILNLAARVDADLIVVGSRRSSFWLKHVERGLTPRLLAEATCPILSIS
ncbi:Nucleotide-binding universal stress protein, UspA family [Granulicella rosea]|uniref:Nucleotide-binding universal stress protein, UspA family n=1 Tax=Granulicella rosea TaxID=474952 RepID=A0A239IWH6_9BACT|nr:universal stress protein [Granulicella rosea]SNS97885.1 Nucleotide-binding universal stress protein, UspA family [Granulicella rosea]